jgi:hypothetical protein
MSFNLSDLCDQISATDSILKAHGYAFNGPGTKPWSHQWDHTNGTAIDIRGSDWTYYSRIGEIVKEGITPAELETFLKGL